MEVRAVFVNNDLINNELVNTEWETQPVWTPERFWEKVLQKRTMLTICMFAPIFAQNHLQRVFPVDRETDPATHLARGLGTAKMAIISSDEGAVITPFLLNFSQYSTLDFPQDFQKRR